MLAVSTFNIPVVEALNKAFRPAAAAPASMNQKIIGFDRDTDEDWRAMLACGHYQHVRHNPPLTVREWTQTKAGREEKIGAELECRKCDEMTARDFDI